MIFTGFGSEVEVKVLVAACTNVDMDITIQAYKATVNNNWTVKVLDFLE